MSKNGLITKVSKLDFEQTIAKIEALLTEKGFHIFSIIDHAKSAQKHGRNLNPTMLFIFGNPKTGGTGLMQENQEIAIDLPAKILVWKNQEKQTYITTNDFNWITSRHNLSDQNKDVIEKLRSGILEIIDELSVFRK